MRQSGQISLQGLGITAVNDSTKEKLFNCMLLGIHDDDESTQNKEFAPVARTNRYRVDNI